MEALVERLTYEKYPDPEFMQDFLLTYRSFTTPTELMQMVFERFNVAPPPGATEDEIDGSFVVCVPQVLPGYELPP